MRVPQRDGKNIDAPTRLIALHRHQIPEKARSRFKYPQFRRRSQPTSEYDEVEIHCVPFPGSAGGQLVPYAVGVTVSVAVALGDDRVLH